MKFNEKLVLNASYIQLISATSKKVKLNLYKQVDIIDSQKNIKFWKYNDYTSKKIYEIILRIQKKWMGKSIFRI